ncbi:tRNA modification GTPase MnmE [Pirellula sp. SH-Sr6A]|uniref:GTPase n=1 Tax=Pirellula sp. SH-Sr6A TaxID=1632865 RepID=UPI00078C96D9|nr:GTPase [Pirellula sp. SH-Sr6A]AMV34016.1 tRNA modification GTPase MnmE [Pirellula sp. SH-Sr6A]
MTNPPSRAYRITSSAPAAIAVLIVEGPEAWGWLQTHWRPILGSVEKAPALNRIRYGSLFPQHDASAGESIVLCRTAEERFELHCHGGPSASNAILDSLSHDGFEIESPVDSFQFFESDAFSMEATRCLLHASSLAVTRILIDQARGALSREIQSISTAILQSRDADAETCLQNLLRWEPLGLHLVEPWKVVLAGPPNAGKSSLLNKLLGYDRTIVHASAGTTRDLIPESTSLGGWPVVLTDSAGVRETDDAIEQRGVASSLEAVSQADAILLLVPRDTGWSDEHERILACALGKRFLLVLTKCDLANDHCDLPSVSHPGVQVSIHDPMSIEQLMSKIEALLVPQIPPKGTPIPFLPHHFDRLRECLQMLQSGQRAEALRSLLG